MPTTLSIERVATFKKLQDKSAQVGVQPNPLNEDPRLYGQLQSPLDLTCPGFKDEGYGDLFKSFFDYIIKTSRQGTPLKQAIAADFVTNRQNLTTFAASSFEGRHRTEVRAIRKNGVIFLCDRWSENETTYDSFGGGYKFEQYMTLNENGEPHRGEVSNAECVKSVIRNTLKSGNDEIKVFYAAEVAARDKNGLLGEIKTALAGYDRWIQNKSLKNYLQSYFGNVSFIIKGLRDGDVVNQVERINTNDIPNMKGVKWNPQHCNDRLFEVLLEIKKRLRNDNEALIININGLRVSYRHESVANCHFVDQAFLDYFS